MANRSVNHIVLSPQEIAALINVIKISLEAFRLADYPLFYDCFLMNLHQLVQLGAAAVTLATPPLGFKEFSQEFEVLEKFMRKVKAINYFKFQQG